MPGSSFRGLPREGPPLARVMFSSLLFAGGPLPTALALLPRAPV